MSGTACRTIRAGSTRGVWTGGCGVRGALMRGGPRGCALVRPGSEVRSAGRSRREAIRTGLVNH
jgi:hypothetical protein